MKDNSFPIQRSLKALYNKKDLYHKAASWNFKNRDEEEMLKSPEIKNKLYMKDH